MTNLEFQNATYVTKKFVGKIQTTQNIRISVKKEIAQVLSVGSESAIVSYEATKGSVSFYGKTNIKFLYNDGVGIVSSNYNADFTSDIQNDLLDVNSKLVFDVATVETKVDISANTAMLSVLLEITAYAYLSQTTPYLSGGEDVFTQKQNVTLLKSMDVANIPFIVDEELTATQTIDTVLLAESTLCVTNYSVSNDLLTAQGNATVRLTYLSDGKILTDTLPFTFSQEVEYSCNEGCKLNLLATVRTTKVRLNIAEEGTNNTFSVDIHGTLQVEKAVVDSVAVVTDAYGTNCNFTFEKQNIITTLPCENVVGERGFSANIPTERTESLQTAVNVSATVTKCTSMQGFATVDGIVYATILFEGENVESELLEIPFSQRVESATVTPDFQTMAKAVVSNFVITKNGGYSAEVKLCITLQSAMEKCYTVITNAQTVPFDKTQLPAMEVCLARKGETLWELAKNLHIAPEDILATNNDLTDPLSSDARIVIFNKI